MHTTLEKFIAITDSLTTSVQPMSWNEDFTMVDATFSGPISRIINAGSINNALTDFEIAHELVVGDKTINFNEAVHLNSLRMGEFQSDPIIEITIYFDKFEKLGLLPNSAFFFRDESFIKWMDFTNESFISFLNGADHQKRFNFYLSVEQSSHSDYLSVIPITELSSDASGPITEEARNEFNRIVKLREGFTRVSDSVPIPQAFQVSVTKGHLETAFSNTLYFCCLLHLANKYLGAIFTFRGQKTVELIKDSSFAPVHHDVLFKLFAFSYASEQPEDKIEITRNVITIYLAEPSFESLDKQLERISKTADRHFSLYINDKVKKFFAQTKDAVQEAHKFATQASDQADKIVTNINTSMLGLITAVFSGVVVVTKVNKLYFIAALAIHFVYFIAIYNVNRHFITKRKENISDLYTAYNEKFSTINDEEQTEIKNTYIDPPLKLIDTNLRTYKIVTICLCCLMILGIAGAMIYPLMTSKPQRETASSISAVHQKIITVQKTTSSKSVQGSK